MEGKKQFTSWENREREILESLSFRVETAEELKKTIEEVTLDQSNEEVSDHLEDCFQKIQSRFPRETIDDFQRLLELEKELKEIEIELLEMEKKIDEDTSETDQQTVKTHEEKFNEQVKKREEYNQLLANLDISFLQKIKRIIENLIKKNEYIKKILEDREEPRDKATALFLKTEDIIKKDDIDKVSFEPFSIIFDVKKPRNSNVGGSYFLKTPFIAIYNSEGINEEPNKELKLEHEKTHNFLEAAEYGKDIIGFNFLKRCLNPWQKSKKLSEGVREVLKEMIKKTKYFHLINSEHGEISATIEQFVQSEFGALSSEEKILRNVFGRAIRKNSERKSFLDIVDNFATAGSKMKEISEYLEDKIREERDEEIKDFLLKLRRDIEDGFVRVGKDIEEVIKITQFLGEDAKEKVNILFLMLLPTQYRHIKSYLRYTYGEELISEAERKARIVT